MRIKGWKRNKESKTTIEWIHDSNDAFVRIFKVANEKGTMKPPHYQVVLVPQKVRSKTKFFKTKPGAIRFAIRWMRRHPKG